MDHSPKPLLFLLLIFLALVATACEGPDIPLVPEASPTAAGPADQVTVEATLPPTPSPTTPPDTPTPIPEGTPVLVALQAVEVRTGPGPGFEALLTLPAGQVTIIQGRSADGRWWVVQGRGDGSGPQGWIPAEAVVTGGDTSELPVLAVPAEPEQPAATEPPPATDMPVELAGAAPGAGDAGGEGEAPAATAVQWPAVVSGPYVLAQQAAEVRSGPGQAYALLGVLPDGQEVPLLGRSLDGRWWVVPGPGDGSGPQGWVEITAVTAYEGETSVPVVDAPAEPPAAQPPAAEPPPVVQPTAPSSLTAVPPTPVPGTPTPVPVIVYTGAPPEDACVAQHPGGEGVVNVYLGPHEKFPLIAWLVNWAPVLETRTGWYQVQTAPGETGWVAAGTVNLAGPCD